MNQQIDDYRRLFVDDVPLLDVRAPVEFARGAFPCAENRPLLTDAEREAVGIAYKERGNDEAFRVGQELVQGAIKADRVSSWHAFADENPHGAMYCFRGGQRSEIAQSWLYDDGVEYPRVRGGYKAMRQFLLSSLERLAGAFDITLIGGRTGVGKTELLPHVPSTLDLEGLANHRGSGFGRRVSPQPTQVGFENALSIDLLKHEDAGHRQLVVEDESRCIGACSIPESVWSTLSSAPVVLLEDSLESRIRRTRIEYVETQLEEFRSEYGEDGFDRFADHLRQGLQRISRRLGGDRFKQLSATMGRALERQRESGSTTAHESWIEGLLVDYYDPMYDYQIQAKGDRVQFVGDRQAVLEYLTSRQNL